MASKQQALAVINQQGGAVDWDYTYITRGQKDICIDAPAGYYWAASQAEVLCISWYSGSASDFWGEVLDEANEGLQKI